MANLWTAGKLAKNLALTLASLSALTLTSCGLKSKSPGPGADLLNTDLNTSGTEIEVNFADDGSILGPEVLVSADGEFVSEITFNDEEEEALEEARALLVQQNERFSIGKSRLLRQVAACSPQNYRTYFNLKS